MSKTRFIVHEHRQQHPQLRRRRRSIRCILLVADELLSILGETADKSGILFLGIRAQGATVRESLTAKASGLAPFSMSETQYDSC